MEPVASAPAGDNGAVAAATAPTNDAAPITASVAPNMQTTAAPIDWLAGADETTIGWAQNKGWQSPVDVVKSYQNLEKLMGADRAGNAIVPPKHDAPQPEWDAFYNRLGRPADATGYKIEVPEGIGDAEFAKVAAGKFHELGLTQKQGEALAQWWNQTAGSQFEQAQQAKVQQFEADVAALRKEWGEAHDQNVIVAKHTASALGLDAKTIDSLSDALGHKGVMELLVKIGSKSGEADFVSGGIQSFTGALTPGQAKAQIAAKMSDKNFTAKYLNKDAEAVAEMERLHKYAYPAG